MNFQEHSNNLLMEINDSDLGETDVEDIQMESTKKDNKIYFNNNTKQSNENIELTNILNSFTRPHDSNAIKRYDSNLQNGPPPIINILAENYRIKLTEKIANCNLTQNNQLKFVKQIIPILYLTPHIPQNKRHVHFIPDRYDTVPPNATVFDFNAAMMEHNERITERQELAIAYAEMLCSDVSSSSNSTSHLSPCFKYSSQRLAAKIAFDRTPQPKNSKPTLPARQNPKKKIKIYQVREQNDRNIFSDCCKESFYNQQNCSYGQNSFLNDALSIFKVNVPNTKTVQLKNSKKQNSKKCPSLSKPQRYRSSNRNNKFSSSGCIERENSSIRNKSIRAPLQIISPNSFDGQYLDSPYYENQNNLCNSFNEEYY